MEISKVVQRTSRVPGLRVFCQRSAEIVGDALNNPLSEDINVVPHERASVLQLTLDDT